MQLAGREIRALVVDVDNRRRTTPFEDGMQDADVGVLRIAVGLGRVGDRAVTLQFELDAPLDGKHVQGGVPVAAQADHLEVQRLVAEVDGGGFVGVAGQRVAVVDVDDDELAHAAGNQAFFGRADDRRRAARIGLVHHALHLDVYDGIEAAEAVATEFGHVLEVGQGQVDDLAVQRRPVDGEVGTEVDGAGKDDVLVTDDFKVADPGREGTLFQGLGARGVDGQDVGARVVFRTIEAVRRATHGDVAGAIREVVGQRAADVVAVAFDALVFVLGIRDVPRVELQAGTGDDHLAADEVTVVVVDRADAFGRHALVQLLGRHGQRCAVGDLEEQVDAARQIVDTQRGERGAAVDDDLDVGVGAEDRAFDAEVGGTDGRKLLGGQGQQRVVAGVARNRVAVDVFVVGARRVADVEAVVVEDDARDAGQFSRLQVGDRVHEQRDVLATDERIRVGRDAAGEREGVAGEFVVIVGVAEDHGGRAGTGGDLEEGAVAFDVVARTRGFADEVVVPAADGDGVATAAAGDDHLVGQDLDGVLAGTGGDVHLMAERVDGVATVAGRDVGHADPLVDFDVDVVRAVAGGDAEVARIVERAFRVRGVAGIHRLDLEAVVAVTGHQRAGGGFDFEMVVAVARRDVGDDGVYFVVVIAVAVGDVDAVAFDFVAVVARAADDRHRVVVLRPFALLVGGDDEDVVALRTDEGDVLRIVQRQVHAAGVGAGVDGDGGFVLEGIVQVAVDVQRGITADRQFGQSAADVFAAEGVGSATQRHQVQGVVVVDEVQVAGDLAQQQFNRERAGLALAPVQVDVLREAAFQACNGAVADAGDGQAAGQAVVFKAVVGTFGDDQAFDAGGTRQVEDRIAVGAVVVAGAAGAGVVPVRVVFVDPARLRVVVGVDVGQVLDPHFLDVEQRQRLGEHALGVDFQDVVAEAGVDVGAVQQFQATGHDDVVARRRDAGFDGAAVVGIRRQLDGLVAVFGTRSAFLDDLLEQARIAFGVEQQVVQEGEIGLTQLHFGAEGGAVEEGDVQRAAVVDVDAAGVFTQRAGQRAHRQREVADVVERADAVVVDQAQLVQVQTGDGRQETQQVGDRDATVGRPLFVVRTVLHAIGVVAPVNGGDRRGGFLTFQHRFLEREGVPGHDQHVFGERLRIFDRRRHVGVERRRLGGIAERGGHLGEHVQHVQHRRALGSSRRGVERADDDFRGIGRRLGAGDVQVVNQPGGNGLVGHMTEVAVVDQVGKLSHATVLAGLQRSKRPVHRHLTDLDVVQARGYARDLGAIKGVKGKHSENSW